MVVTWIQGILTSTLIDWDYDATLQHIWYTTLKATMAFRRHVSQLTTAAPHTEDAQQVDHLSWVISTFFKCFSIDSTSSGEKDRSRR